MTKVSVIVANYNNGIYLTDCLESLVNQTYENLEIVVVDDCSTDNSLDIIQHYANKYHNIVLISNTVNKGIQIVRHIGASASTGDWIMQLDADDYLEIDAIDIHMEAVSVYDDIDIVYCDYIDFRDNKVVEYVNRLDWEYIYNFCSASPWSLFRRKYFDIFEHTFNFPRHIGGEDWDFWISLSEYGCKAYHITGYLHHRRLHDRNLSNISDPLHFPYIILRHPNSYSSNQIEEANNYVKIKHPEFIGQEWLKPIIPKEIA